MGLCLSCATKVSGCNSINTAGGTAQQGQPAALNRPGGHQQAAGRRAGGKVPYGKRTDFGYDKDFESRYAIGKLLGHGQFGYTFVAAEKVSGERVAVKRIDKNKVIPKNMVFLWPRHALLRRQSAESSTSP